MTEVPVHSPFCRFPGSIRPCGASDRGWKAKGTEPELRPFRCLEPLGAGPGTSHSTMRPVGNASPEIDHPLDDGSWCEADHALGPSAQAIDDRCAAAAHGERGLAARERHHPEAEENEGETECPKAWELGTRL